MPIIKSAKKALRQNTKRKVRNLRKKRGVKKLFKEISGLVLQKKFEKAKELLPMYYKALDKTAKTKTIKTNRAAKKKSRITKFINKMDSRPAGKAK